MRRTYVIETSSLRIFSQPIKKLDSLILGLALYTIALVVIVVWQHNRKGIRYTPSYMSPEVVTKQKYDGRTTDIWALGVLFVGLLQGSFPYKGSSEKELFSKIRNNEYTINSQDKDVRVFLGQIFVLDPHHRATAKELLQCDVFRYM